MQTQFFKIASSLQQKLKCSTECFTKVLNSLRKYRKVYLSDVYFYVLTEEKVKCRLAVGKIKKIIASMNSAQFVLVSEGKTVLVDCLTIRPTCIKQIKKLNDKVEVVYVKQPLLDEYVEGKKEDNKEEAMLLDLNRMRSMFNEFGPDPFKKNFDQQYKIQQCLLKSEDCSLVIVSQTKLKEQFRKKKKKKKQESIKFTVKIYPKEPVGKDRQLLNSILNQKKYLEEIMSPYFPVLYKCMLSKTYAYCMTELYKGDSLQYYITNETLHKNTLKLLLAQIAVALGQLHECNLVYNNINVKGIFVTDKGYILLNDLSKCGRMQAYSLKLQQQFHTDQEKQIDRKPLTADIDWLQLGELIYFIKEGKKYQEGNKVQLYKPTELTDLANDLLQKNHEKRLGHKNDYYEVLAHPYFKGINKNDLATQTCQPIKKFFEVNHANFSHDKLSSFLEKQDWSVYDDLFKDYEYCRQLQD